MVATRRRTREASAAQPDNAGSSPEPEAVETPKAPRTPWYLWTAPDCKFELHPDDDADVPVPLIFKLWVGAIIAYLAWSVFIGQPAWPPVTYDC